MRRRLGQIGLVWFLLSLVGCGTEPDAFGRCTGGLPVTVAYAPALQLHWSPADCDMFTLSIDNQAQILMWDLSSLESSNHIESPVTYGVAPPGTDGTVAQTMAPGRYRIVMTRINADSRVVLAVDQEFTIP